MKRKLVLIFFIIFALLINCSYATDTLEWDDERYVVENYDELYDAAIELENAYDDLSEDYSSLKEEYDDLYSELEEVKEKNTDLEEKIEELESERYELKEESTKRSEDSNSGSKTGYIIFAVCIMLIVFSPMLYGIYEAIKKK